MHPSDGELQALADGEAPEARAAAAREHLALCPGCAARLAQLEAMAARLPGLLRELDHAVPEVRLDAVTARAARWAVRRRRAVAAGIGGALLVAGAAAAAIPGTPLHRLVLRALRPARPVPQQPREAARPAAPVPAAPSGIAFVPEGAVEIAFGAAQAAGTIRVAATDSDAVRVTHAGGAAGYALTARGVAVDNAGSTASYDVRLPRRAARVTVRVAGRVVYSREAGRVATAGSADAAGRIVIDLGALRRGAR